MGVYSNDRTGLSGSVNVDPDTRYFGESALGLMLVEAQQNDMSLFDAVIRSDINESVSIREGTILESEIAALQEGVLSNIRDRIVVMWRKFLAKIKHVFDVFIAKITSLTVTDGKKFLAMNQKRLSKDIAKIKCKYRKEKNKTDKVSGSIEAYIDEVLDNDKYGKMSSEVIEKREEDMNDADNGIVAQMLSKSIGGSSTNRSEYTKDLIDFLFEDEDEVNVGDILPKIKETIGGGKKQIEGLKRMRNDLTTKITKLITGFEKLEKTVTTHGDDASKAGNDKLRDNNYKIAKAFNLAAREGALAQTGMTTIINAVMNATKFDIAQARRCYVRGCMNPKKEDAVLCDMVEEAAEFDLMQSFEDFSIPELA